MTETIKSKNIPRDVWALGFVSLLMDISSEIIHSLLPVFLVSIIGASAMTVGLIEGLGEGVALVTKLFSGAISDWLGKRKVLAVIGYLLGTLCKPLFAIAPNVEIVLTARLLDRLGKGIRGAPRDALIADLTPPAIRGAAYGLRQSLDSVGAVIGPLLAIVLMRATLNSYRTVFWYAAIPGLFAVALLIFFVREPVKQTIKSSRFPIHREELSRLSTSYWAVLVIGVLFTLARFSEAFILLRAQNVGLADYLIPIVLAVISLSFSLGAYPAGRLSDRIDRHIVLGLGLVVLIAADAILAIAHNVPLVLLGALFWGFHLALTQGILSSLIADTASEEIRGTAFGLFGLATGVAVLLASLIAGWLWTQFGAPVTFITGGAFSFVALLGFLLVYRKSRNRKANY